MKTERIPLDFSPPFFQIIKMRGIAGDSPSFSLDFWKRGWGYEWEEEKSKKSLIESTFHKKILSYSFLKGKSVWKWVKILKIIDFSKNASLFF